MSDHQEDTRPVDDIETEDTPIVNEEDDAIVYDDEPVKDELKESTDFSVDDIGNDVEDEMDNEDIQHINNVFSPSNDIDDVLEKIAKLHDELGKDKFVKEWNSIGTYVNTLNILKDSYSDANTFVGELLKRFNPATTGSSFESDDGKIKLKNMRPSVKKQAKEVSGKKAKLLVMASKKNIRKVFLYGSGFYVVLRSPTLDELYVLYSKLADQSKHYGSQFGMAFYMFADYFIKEALCEFIEELVIDSNLTNWKRNNALFKAMSITDYDNVLLNIGIMLFKDGYPFVHTCLHDDCEHVEKETIDLELLQQTDFSKLTEEQVNLISKPKVSLSDTSKYKSYFNFEGVIRIDGYNFYTSVPSMYEFMKYGKTFHTDLFNLVSDIDDEQAVSRYIVYSFNRQLAPWISKMEVTEDKEVVLTTKDRDAILVALNMLQENTSDSNTLKEKLDKFTEMVFVTTTGYRMEGCPKCNKPYTGLVNGFIPFDSQKMLFTMVAMKLIQVS